MFTTCSVENKRYSQFFQIRFTITYLIDTWFLFLDFIFFGFHNYHILQMYFSTLYKHMNTNLSFFIPFASILGFWIICCMRSSFFCIIFITLSFDIFKFPEFISSKSFFCLFFKLSIYNSVRITWRSTKYSSIRPFRYT